MKPALLASALALATALLGAASANAAIFTVRWSGEQFGNSASAVGSFNINTAVYPDLGGAQNINPVGGDFQILSLTVSGASAGNGGFTQSDFSYFFFAAFSPLDYSQELIGQSLTNGFNFGSFGAGYNGPSGDFNLFAATGGTPTGTYFFQLTTAGGENIGVTSIAPGVPEAATWAMMIAGFGLVGAAMRRRSAALAA